MIMGYEIYISLHWRLSFCWRILKKHTVPLDGAYRSIRFRGDISMALVLAIVGVVESHLLWIENITKKYHHSHHCWDD